MPETNPKNHLPFRIYKSSAGSGKTTALVRIFLSLILKDGNPNHFQKVLAITFTNKATAEMKGRLLEELKALANIGDGDTKASHHFMATNVMEDTGLSAEALRRYAAEAFTRILFDYGSLSISTIDRFNHKLIRAFSRELNLRSDFQVEMDMDNLFGEAVMRLVERVGYDHDVTHHLTAFVAEQQEDDKRARITKSLNDLQSLVTDEEALPPLASLEGLEADFFTALSAKMRETNAAFEEEVRTNAREALALLDSIGATQDDFYGRSSGWYNAFVKLAQFPISTVKSVTSLTKSLEKDWANTRASKAMKAAIASIEGPLTTFAEKALHLMIEDKKAYLLRKEILARLHLVAILKDLRTELAAVCDERNILPIAYFNRTVSESLREEPVAFIYENLGNRYEHILIDEFQDTSEMQWLNLLPLVEESIAKGKTSLVVGDAKQSIYRWRGGKAEQLIRLPEVKSEGIDIKPGLKEALRRSHQITELNTNYRSKGHVIEFNNQFFGALKGIMTQPESLYLEEYNHVAQLIPERAAAQGFVEVNNLGKSAPKEAHYMTVLDQIKDLMERGYKAGEICLLVRSTKNEGNPLAAFLIQQGLSVSTSDSRTIDQDPAVRFLIAMLRLHVDPHHNPAKLQAMRFLAAENGWAYAPWNYQVQRGKDKNKKADLDIHKFFKVHGLPALRNDWYAGGAMQACENLMRTYAERCITQPAVLKLLDDIQGKGGQRMTVADYLHKWDEMKTKPSAGNTEGDGSIRMMTIHKAKGLQFKACILPLCNWKMDKESSASWVHIGAAIDEALPYVPLKITKTLNEIGLNEAFDREAAAKKFDNLNLLYVALTRAEEALYINYTHSASNHIGKHIDEAMIALQPAMLETAHATIEEGAYDGMEFGEKLLEDTWRLRYGKQEQTKHEDKKDQKDTGKDCKVGLPFAANPSKTWPQRFPFAYDPKQAGPAISRRLGILFHRLASENGASDQAKRWIQSRLASSEIDGNESKELEKMAAALYGNARYSSLLKSGKILSERELVLHGEVVRPDLVVDHGTSMTVVDFKTGAEKDSHKKQVRDYASALREALGKETKAALLYLDPLQWADV